MAPRRSPATPAARFVGSPDDRRTLERIPMGRRRRFPAQRSAAPDDGIQRREAVERHRHAVGTRSSRVDGSQRADRLDAARLQRGHGGSHLQRPEWIFRRRRRRPGRSRRKIATSFQTDSDPSGDFVDFQFRIGYHPGVGTSRLFRRRRPPPPPPAAAASAASSRPIGPPTVDDHVRSAVHGARAGTIDRAVGTGARPGRRHADVPLDRPDRHLLDADGAHDAVDGAAGLRRQRADHGHRRRRQGRNGHRRSANVAVDAAAAAGRRAELRGRVLRLRPFDAQARGASAARRCGGEAAGEPDAQHDHRGPHLQHRHVGVQPGARRTPRTQRAELPRRRAAFRRAGSRSSATARNVRSSTTRAKKRAG